MGILDIIGEFFATEELPELDCKHDWELIHPNENSVKYYTLRVCNRTVKDGAPVISFRQYDDLGKSDAWMERPSIQYRPLCQKVCLNCGECVDEVVDYKERRKEEMKQQLIAAEARARRFKQRQELAHKLWEECKK
jgi:hypothetical protein